MRLRSTRSMIALAALAVSAACAPSEEAQEMEVAEIEPVVTPAPAPATAPGMDPAGTMAGAPTELLNITISAAEGGLTNLEPSTAVNVIGEWQTRLRAANNPALTLIADDLQVLQTQLQNTPIDGGEVGRILIRLGEQTTAVASSAEPGVTDQLLRLGTLLSEAGRQLAGM